MLAAFLLLGLALDPRLERLAEEAGAFARSAEKLIGEETIRQRAVAAPPRFRPRIGAAALEPPPERWMERELKSEFAYARFRAEGSDQGSIHEARQVLALDGRAVTATAKAREQLALGLRSDDDKLKRRLLEDLRKYGLPETATDFTLTLLLFEGSGLNRFLFTPTREVMLGADRAQVFQFTQKDGDSAFTVFHGRRMYRQRMEGEVWLRAEDSLPVKIVFQSLIPDADAPVLDHGEVEYARSPHGILVPVAAAHRRTIAGRLTAESRFSYGNFKRFGADSEIRFTAEDEPLPTAPQGAKPDRR
jgi:hypothetical protein